MGSERRGNGYMLCWRLDWLWGGISGASALEFPPPPILEHSALAQLRLDFAKNPTSVGKAVIRSSVRRAKEMVPSGQEIAFPNGFSGFASAGNLWVLLDP